VLRVGATLLAVVANIGLFTVAFRVLTASEVATRELLVGAVVAGVGWQVVQILGTYFVTHSLKGSQEAYGVFGLVLGLVAWIYLLALVTVVATEINVVAARRLWPRALLTPFTDAVDLTDADRRAYASYALMNRHKGFETVAVTFDGRDGDTHEIVMDPSWARKSRLSRRRPEVDAPGPHELDHPRDRL
jgi:hypothetical protein